MRIFCEVTKYQEYSNSLCYVENITILYSSECTKLA